MADFAIQVVLGLVDRLTAPLKGPMQMLQAVEKQAQRVEMGTQQLFNGAGLMAGGMAFAAPLGLAAQSAIELESAMADVRKVVDFPTPQAFQDMQNDLMELSNRIPIAVTGFAEIAAAAGQAGIARSEIVRFSEDAAKMGVAFDMVAKDAGGAMTGLRTIFRLTQDGVVSLGDSVNYLSNNMDAKASNIVDILNRTGGIGTQLGLSGQQLAALGATFLALKKPPEVAATGINALLNKLSTAEQQSKSFQDGLKSVGLTAQQVKRWMGEDAQGGLLKFLDTVRGSKDVMGTLGQIAGAEYADDFAALVGNMDTYRKALGLTGDATKYAGSMNAEYEAKANTTANALELLKNNVFNLRSEVGSHLAPSIREAAEWIGRVTQAVQAFAQAHPEAIDRIVRLAAGIAGVIFAVGLLTGALGLVNVAVGQAIGGWGLFKNTLGGIKSAAIGAGAHLVKLGAHARTANLTDALKLQQNATGMSRFSLAATGAGAALRGAAVNAWRFAAALLANPITWVVAAVVALGAAFIYAWRTSAQFRDNIMKALAPLQESWAQLQASFSSLWTALQGAGGHLGKFFTQFKGPLDSLAYLVGFVLGFVVTGIVALGAALFGGIADLISGVVDIVTGGVNWIVGFFTGDTEKMRLGATQILNGLERVWQVTFGNMALKVAEFGGKVLTFIQDKLGLAYQWVVNKVESWKQAGVNLILGLLTGVQMKILGVRVEVQRGINQAKDWLGDVVGGWRQAGIDLIDGLVGGISSKISGAVKVVTDLANRVKGAFTTGVDAHSPSRVFMTYGGWVVDGLALGISKNAESAVGASRSLALGVAAAGSVSLGAAISPVTSGGLGGGSPLAPAQASAVSGGGTTIVIQRLEVRSDNPNDFLAGLQQLVSHHQ